MRKESYLVIDEKKIPLSEDQIRMIKGGEKKLGELMPGDLFKVGDYEFIVLEDLEIGTAVILKELLHVCQEFGKNNNYNGANVDALCNKFAEEIKGIIGKENLIEHTVDLTSDDGLKDYGEIRRFASLLTADRYRRYVEILDKYKLDDWWWLATAHSTPTHDNALWVKCVSPSGIIDYYSYDYYDGVRPFCIFNSNIFVSK